MKGLTKIKGITTDDIKKVLSSKKMRYCAFQYTRESATIEDDKFKPNLWSLIITETRAKGDINEAFFGKPYNITSCGNFYCYTYVADFKVKNHKLMEEDPYLKKCLFSSSFLPPKEYDKVEQITSVVYHSGLAEFLYSHLDEIRTSFFDTHN